MATARHYVGGFLVSAIFISLYIFYVQDTQLTVSDFAFSRLKSFYNYTQKCYNHTLLETRYETGNRQKLFPCDDVTGRSHYGQRGTFWVLYNYVTAKQRPACDESITYTTHSDYTFLDNLVPLVERWRGPVSISVYAPGTDFEEALQRIQFLVQCASPLVKEFVNFHLFFDAQFIPKNVPNSFSQFTSSNVMDCSEHFSLFDESENSTKVSFKSEKKLRYPVNVARNIAREMAPTHYLLASDIELYPSPDLIPRFFEMLKRNDVELQRERPKLFVLPIFEIDGKVGLNELPMDKGELQKMLKDQRAIPFHKFVCEACHRIPRQVEWIKNAYRKGDPLKVFYVGKRLKGFQNWEPIYIGTKQDPFYDERLSWDGQKDKMTQGYVLCVLDYEFHILNNAFLTHRPGIKRPPGKKKTKEKAAIERAQNSVISKTILPELKILYGVRKGCVV